ncbi:MAG: hypothetical protein CFE39_04235 [Comamonadaceae bacterium PBBC2]|nr:MAG: hypothetical protein CFE39_04235 [Comamonadaceae bacterium PBBC2]
MKFSIHFWSATALAALLTACGGGGGGSTPTPTVAVAGVAVDGYLKNALAFLDLNGNEKLDAGEPSARTNERGEFTLNATAEQKATASVVVLAIAGETIDMDQPNTPLTAGMTLVAPAGKPEVVSPLSTWVAGIMRRENKTLDKAKASVAAELGLNAEDLLQDFVAKSPNGSPSDAYKVAVSLAEVLKSTPANADKDARFDHVSTNLRSVTDNLTAIKGAALTDVRALVKEDIALNNLITAPACVTSTSIGWLTDYRLNANTPNLFNQAFDDCVPGQFNVATKRFSFPNTTVRLTRDNIRALVDGNANTSGRAPNFSLIVGNDSGLEGSQTGKVAIALTKANSSSQVTVTLDVEILKLNNKLTIRAQNKNNVTVNVVTGLGPITKTIDFSPEDVIASTSMGTGNMVLNINVLGLLTKLDGLLNYPTTGDYTITITNNDGQDWPFKTMDGNPINSISIGLPIY